MQKNSNFALNEIWLKDLRFSNWLLIDWFSDNMLFISKSSSTAKKSVSESSKQKTVWSLVTGKTSINAENLWILKVVKIHFSFYQCVDLNDLFETIFYNSCLWMEQTLTGKSSDFWRSTKKKKIHHFFVLKVEYCMWYIVLSNLSFPS